MYPLFKIGDKFVSMLEFSRRGGGIGGGGGGNDELDDDGVFETFSFDVDTGGKGGGGGGGGGGTVEGVDEIDFEDAFNLYLFNYKLRK